MLKDKMVAAILPAKDVQRAKDFYHSMLGLDIQTEVDAGVMLSAGQGTSLFIYPREDMESSGHTVAGFNVENIEEEVGELKSKGVNFEEYDMPGIKTVDSVADLDGVKSAWFRDSEGNIIAINQM